VNTEVWFSERNQVVRRVYPSIGHLSCFRVLNSLVLQNAKLRQPCWSCNTNWWDSNRLARHDRRPEELRAIHAVDEALDRGAVTRYQNVIIALALEMERASQ
jgi:hypothetical protein